MSIPDVDNAQYPTSEEVLNQMLADVLWAYDQNGITVNVSPGSELYERFKVIATRVSIAIANNELALADVSPLDATGDALEEYAGIWGITKRPASSGVGKVTITVLSPAATVTIPDAFVCTSPSGIQYKTIGAHTLATLATVPVEAVSAGSGTDADDGDIFTWDSAAIGFLGQTCVVTASGITGGAEEDTEEILRERFLERLRAPSVGGNAAHVSTFAEEHSAAIQRAFVYMAARGAGSFDVAITKAGTDRTHSSSLVGTAAATIISKMPGFSDLGMTSVTAEYVDVIIDMELALPASAGGAGGGWRDAVVYPSDADATNLAAEIVAPGPDLTNNTIPVNSTAEAPVIGQRFGIWIPATATVAAEMREYVISLVAGGAGAYVITIDTSASDALTDVVAGMRLSAGCENLKQYAADYLAAFETLGPGQKTSEAARLPRALRAPPQDEEWPAGVTALQTTAVINSNKEIIDMEYAARFATGTVNTLLLPSIPANITDPPKQLVLKHLSFRSQS